MGRRSPARSAKAASRWSGRAAYHRRAGEVVIAPLDILRDALARVTWLREEFDPAVRERALEDLELDLAGYLASSLRNENLAAADRRAA